MKFELGSLLLSVIAVGEEVCVIVITHYVCIYISIGNSLS